MKVSRIKYKYQGRYGDFYYWETFIPGDSRVMVTRCHVDWFWKTGPWSVRSRKVS